ncbi:unnamed protein product [Xyrichtys novacula]|uniref:Unnamed protein product n=1 Tax=Xyrichtys novacula TaxID=13765 RepID=A0AAV1HED8_XYRNO|nr:unnamed protein product [Xyrichtys novacula]
MLIKSECQPLDKTRRKPARNLFEQREPCKMAREICSAAWPLNPPHRPVIVAAYNMSGETDRQTDRWRETARNPPRPTSPVLSQGDISPLTLRVNRRVCDGTTMFPFTHTPPMPPSNPLDNHRAGGETYVRAEITGPCNYGEQSLSEQTRYMKEHQWEIRAKNAQGWSVCMAYNRTMIKGEVQRRESRRQVAI